MYIISIISLYFVILIVGYFLFKLINKIYKIITNPVDIGNSFVIFDFKKSFKASGLPLINVEVNGHKCCFLVDSGANRDIIEEDFFNKYIRKDEDNVKDGASLTMINGQSDVLKETEFEFVYEDKYVFVSNFLVHSDITQGFNAIGKDNESRPVGILGSRFLEYYQWQIDFKNKQIWIPIN